VFIKRLLALLLMILVVPPIVVIYYGELANVKEKAPSLSVKNTAVLHLRGSIRDVKLSADGKVAYVAAASRGVYIVDIQNPLKPKLISQFKYFNNSYDKARNLELAQKRNILFVRDAQAGIYSIDITNPSEAKLLSTYTSSEQIYDFCLSKDAKTIYIADKKGITVADIRDFDAISPITHYNIEKKYEDLVEAKKGILYLVSSHDIDIMQTDGAQAAKLVGNYVTAGDAKRISLSEDGTKAFVSSGYTGVEILDIANKLHPKPLGIYKTSSMVNNTLVSKNAKTIYVAGANGNIEIVDIKDPDSAKLLKRIKTKLSNQEQLWNIALSTDEKRVLTASGINGFKIINLR
jgi:hypothetical protein